MSPTDANRDPASTPVTSAPDPSISIPAQSWPPPDPPVRQRPDHSLPAPIHRLVATVCAPTCALGEPDGQIQPAGVAGLYVGDTRAIRRAVLSVADSDLDPLGWQHDGPGATTFFATARDLGDPIPDPTVRVDRTRRVRPDGLDETIRIRSTATTPVRTTVTLSLSCDLTPMELARAGRSRAAATARLAGDTLVWSGGGATVTVAADGARLDAASAIATWPVEVGTDEELTLRWTVRVRDRAPLLVAPDRPDDWARPHITAADPRIAHVVRRALDDVASLRLAEPSSPDDEFIAAGVPWFLTLFGRDSIWAARMMLPLGTSLAAGTLRTLARRQGMAESAASGEAPGKIMHELRRHDARIGLPRAAEASRPAASATHRPESLDVAASATHRPAVYYGTVDATLLWISLLADAWRWGMPDDAVIELVPHLRRALGWLDRYADPNNDGFIEYFDVSGRGLANQGWKDSGTAVRFRDGSMATPPIALCEVQAYAHRAALDAASLLTAFGGATSGAASTAPPRGPGPDTGRLDDPDHWRAYAADLSARFRSRFWVSGPLGDYPAQGLDGAGRPIDALTSNIGHLLGTGLLSPAEESAVAALIAAPELSGGYGLRTMSTVDAAYAPLTYHCGSIWPHDTAITLLGLNSMAPDPQARATATTLSDGLLAAAEAFDYRLPELYSGDARDEAARPLPHPAACRPQAWSATAAIALLQTLLGLSVDVPAGQLSVMPMVTGPMRVDGLRIAGRPIDIDIDAAGRVELSGAFETADAQAAGVGQAVEDAAIYR